MTGWKNRYRVGAGCGERPRSTGLRSGRNRVETGEKRFGSGQLKEVSSL